MGEFRLNIEGRGPDEPTFPRDTEVMQQKIVDSFKGFFKDRKGFMEIEPENLIPENDKSILFTNATVGPFKRYIENDDIPLNGLITEQPCLRAQNLKNMAEGELLYMSYFKMVGILINTKEPCHRREKYGSF